MNSKFMAGTKNHKNIFQPCTGLVLGYVKKHPNFFYLLQGSDVSLAAVGGELLGGGGAPGLQDGTHVLVDHLGLLDILHHVEVIRFISSWPAELGT